MKTIFRNKIARRKKGLYPMLVYREHLKSQLAGPREKNAVGGVEKVDKIEGCSSLFFLR